MSEFNKALYSFTHEVASGGAIRHLADLGYTVDEIKNRLTFPTPIEQIQKTVWKHYIDTGIIRLSNDISEEDAQSGYTYEKEQDKFGNVSFKRVKRVIKQEINEYIPCDFGTRRYRDEEAFLKSLNVLREDDREYILGLPWQVGTVYHVANERMRRIAGALNITDRI